MLVVFDSALLLIQVLAAVADVTDVVLLSELRWTDGGFVY
jgi:hypothetical protein